MFFLKFILHHLFSIIGVILNWFWGLSNYYQKVTGLRVKNFESRKKSIFKVFPSGLREPRPFWNLFNFSIVHYHHKCHLNWFWELSNYYQKVTGLRVIIFESQIKSIFGVFPSGLREPRSFWNFFYFSIVHYHQRCHLNWFWELSDYYQKSYRT